MDKVKRENGVIVLEYGNVSRLADKVGKSVIAVSKALKGTRIVSRENYVLIRRLAVKEFGGRYLM